MSSVSIRCMVTVRGVFIHNTTRSIAAGLGAPHKHTFTSIFVPRGSRPSPSPPAWLRSARGVRGTDWRLRTQTGYAASKVASVQPASRVFDTLISPTKLHFFGAQFIAMAATEELSDILSRRQEINDKLEEGLEIKPKYKFVNVYTEFHEFSRKEIKQYEQTFNK